MNGGTLIPILVIFIIAASITTVVVSHFRLQTHRADAQDMAEYRKLAEEVHAHQEAVQGRLTELSDRMKAIEGLLQDIG
ncbi:hypothetical protein [Streptomyces sp. GS7]|uniref:hypothetical protein n=1 Tax=Streptomyces sp. GS7 TaxID=2692234 RepID=UPI0013174D20|nr:hypothetical protein [Streptomyces sp. GS7]QHC24539.1 hypothetical protein GR130_27370 [Streptomyces sp. GS7]